MHTENTVINNSRNWKDVKTNAKLSPNPHIVPSLTLIVKAIHSVDRLALVVSAQQVKVLWEFDFVRQKKGYRLNTLLTSVHVVTDEQELLVILRVTCNIKKPEKIKILPMHITKHFNRCFEIKQHLLLLENFGAFIYQELECLLVQLHRFAPLATFNFDKLLDDAISDELSLVICRWLHEVFAKFEFFNHFVDLTRSEIVLLAIISDGLAILSELTLRN